MLGGCWECLACASFTGDVLIRQRLMVFTEPIGESDNEYRLLGSQQTAPAHW